jgi:N6-adenosine-specific RNA methylase IME4
VLLSDLAGSDFRCLLVDPPWYFKGYNEEVSSRDVRQHYGVMSLAEIRDLPVASVCAKDAHLFMWTTGPMLEEAFAVLKAWGFKYSTIAFTWVKLKKTFDEDQLRSLPSADGDFHVGLGYTTRKNTELCLLARRGRPQRLARDVRELIVSPRREHSRKPDEVHRRIERYCEGPRLEMFAREARVGWTAWGNEVGKFGVGDEQAKGVDSVRPGGDPARAT